MLKHMETLKFNLPILTRFNEGPLRILEYSVALEFSVKTGDHVFTSTPIEIGSYYDYAVFAHVSIPYSYDEQTQFYTIAGAKDTGDKQITIHTSLEQNAAMSAAHSFNRKNGSYEIRNVWTEFIQNTPTVSQTLQTASRQCIDNLIQNLLISGAHGVIQTGNAPIVTPSNYLDYKALFKPEKEENITPSLEDILEVQIAVDSSYGGTITWYLNYSFANVDGSTHDPKPNGYSSWIQLWADACNGGNRTTHCSSYNYANGAPGFGCSSVFVGGHVIPGTVAAWMPNGSTVYIFPICVPHNNNDNIYMSMRYNPVGVVLLNYNQ